MREFEESVVRYARDHHLFPAPGTVLVALSGGGDSVALLRCLVAVKDEFGISIRAAHLNHALRGDESDGDDTFCRELCETLGVPLTTGRLPDDALLGTGESLETSARRARREFLLSCAHEMSVCGIATGHTSDDRAETVLQRLIRGTGPSGLAGIRPVQGIFVRPLLGATRRSAREYLAGMNAPWREDSSNSDTRMFRNRVRRELMPLLESYSPGVMDALNRLAELSRIDEDYFDECVRKALDACLIYGDGGKILLDDGVFASYHTSLRRRMVRHCLERLEGEGRDTDMEEVGRILRIAEKKRGETGGLGGIRIGAGGGVMAFIAGTIEYRSIPVAMPGTTRIPGDGMIVADHVGSGGKPDGSMSVAVASDVVAGYGPLTVGPALRGEYMVPSGSTESRKVYDMLADCGVPKILRDSVCVVRAGGVPVWIPGVGCAAYLTTGGTGAGAMLLTYREGPEWRKLLKRHRSK